MQNFFTSCRMAVNENELINFVDYFDQYDEEYEITYDDIEEQFNLFIDDGGHDREELKTLMRKFIESAKEENYVLYTTKYSTRLVILEMVICAMLFALINTLFLAGNYFLIVLVVDVLFFSFFALVVRKIMKNETDKIRLHNDRLRACRYASLLIDAYLELNPSDLSVTPNTQKLLYLPAIRPQ